MPAAELGTQRRALHAGHAHVHERHVRREVLDRLEGLVAVARHRHELEPAMLGDRPRESLSVSALIVREQHGDGLG